MDKLWNKIKKQEDIDFLMNEYDGFHDSCLCAVEYLSGAEVDQKGSMRGINKDCTLIMRFDSQMPSLYNQPDKKSLELKFVGLRRFNLVGYQENYFCDIFTCHLSFYKDFIVWSDDYDFEPDNYSENLLIDEPMSMFAISNSLEWRFV